MTPDDKNRIVQIARILRFMRVEVKLDKLEDRAQKWLEKIRLECLKNDDRVRANQRQRVCVSAMRIICCVMLCSVAEKLLKQYGNSVTAVEEVLSHDSTLTEKMLKRLQTEKYLKLFDLVADELLENNLYFSVRKSRQPQRYLLTPHAKRAKMTQFMPD